LNTKRKIFIKVEFCLVKGKAFETRGENFKSWKCFSKSYSFTFDYLQKDFEKDLQKEFAKTKRVVQAWSKMLKIKKQSMHI
jgi:cell division FtsZ-interacting protein ZapD